jgi:hypothetical protein
MAAKKPRFKAYEKTFMAVEVLTKTEKKAKPFMRIERGTKAMASDGKKHLKTVPKEETEETEEKED